MGAGVGKNRRMKASSSLAQVRSNLVTKSVYDLTPAEFKRCYNLTLREEGRMADVLQYERHKYTYDGIEQPADEPSAQTVLIQEPKTKKLLGWALFRPSQPGRGGRGKRRPEVMFYVRATHRRRGLGTILMQEALKLGKPHKLSVSSDDKVAKDFFRRFKCSVVLYSH